MISGAIPRHTGAQALLGPPVLEALLPGKQSFPSRIPKRSLGTSCPRREVGT